MTSRPLLEVDTVDVSGPRAISRIGYATSSPEHYRQIREAAVAAISRLAAELAAAEGLVPGDIADMAVAGNTAMRHLLAGLGVAQLATAPHVAATRRLLDVKARDLGLTVAAGLDDYPGVTESDNGREFRVGGVPFNRGDIRQLQLAKAAIRSGVQALFEATGVSPTEIERIYLAGAFGMALGPASAMDIGILRSLGLPAKAAGSSGRPTPEPY